MIQSTLSYIPIRVRPGDWKDYEQGSSYMGKYKVGRFTLSYEFMVQYMNLIHRIPADINDAQNNVTNENSVMYMEHYGIIDNSILLKMREMVKQPKNGFSVFREKNIIIGIYRDTNHE